MTDYTELVKVLTCGNDGKLPCHNNECPYWVDKWHGIGLCNVIKKDEDAAAAIEALQAEAERLKDSNEELRERQTYIDHYGDRWLTSAKDVPTAAYEHGYADGRGEAEAQLPKRGKWNNHEVACLLAEMFGDDCACNLNGIDEWLPQYCDFAETCCPNPVGVACWEQFLKHRAKMEVQK